MDLESIRVLIRVRMRDGRLPRESAPQAFGQPGNGQKCSVCDEILTTDRLMMEVANHGKIFFFPWRMLLAMDGRAARTNVVASVRVHPVLVNASQRPAASACQEEAPAIIAEPLGAELLAADRQSTVSRCVRPPPCAQPF